MTGLATGPHLHYEYLVNGVHKNPQTVQLAGAEPLRAAALQKFRLDVASLLADLPSEQLTAGPLAATPSDMDTVNSGMFGRVPAPGDSLDSTPSYFSAYRSQFAIGE
jgi:murein DD-endopeptidase MepM/ murein hydrolase activator NlpD